MAPYAEKKKWLEERGLQCRFLAQPTMEDGPNWAEDLLKTPPPEKQNWGRGPPPPKKPKEDWESESTSSSEDSTHPGNPRFVNPMYKDWEVKPFSTDLHTTCHMDLLPYVKEMVEEEGMNIHAEDWAGRTPLWKCYSQEVAEYLVSHGADVTHCNRNSGANLVMRFAAKNREECLEYILQELDKQGKKQEYMNTQAKGSLRTPLMAAAVNNFVAAARVLLDHGADYKIKDRKNKTALALAKDNESTDVLELFKNSGITFN